MKKEIYKSFGFHSPAKQGDFQPIKLKDLIVPQKLKKEFRKIWGKVFTSPEKIKFPSGKKIIAVGDFISYSLIKIGIKPRIIVFDGKIERKKTSKKIVETLKKYCKRMYRVKNPRGMITAELLKTVKRSLREVSRVGIFVDGEEDLAVLPFILESEEKNIIVYGFRKKGIVVLELNEKTKERARKLLNKLRALAQHGRAS
ncbi:MAG: DUF359 domain-containing protein [Candidatus Aenigmarchaeota archaeon]|nr:DUF359 domain-containing protein [Candidatus Aenigmarchaeota archaeon]